MDNHKDNEDIQLVTAEYYRDSAEMRKQKLKAEWSIFLKTGIFVLPAFLALLIGCLAWFANNNRVNGGGMSVKVQESSFRIASKGERQAAEKDFLKLEEGKDYRYGDDIYYYTDGGEIALHLSEKNNGNTVSPGARGSIEFYIIPTRDGAINVTVYLGIAGYKIQTDETGTGQSVRRAEDPVLDALLSGHILLFENYSDGYYSGCLFKESGNGILNNAITVTLEDAKEGVPYPVTLYWIWPLRYENMVYDLYAETSKDEQEQFVAFIDKQSQNLSDISGTDYHYSRIFLTQENSLESTVSRTKAYNLADEYIGTNAEYLYLTIQTPIGN